MKYSTVLCGSTARPGHRFGVWSLQACIKTILVFKAVLCTVENWIAPTVSAFAALNSKTLCTLSFRWWCSHWAQHIGYKLQNTS